MVSLPLIERLSTEIEVSTLEKTKNAVGYLLGFRDTQFELKEVAWEEYEEAEREFWMYYVARPVVQVDIELPI